MKIADISVKRPIGVTMIMIAVILIGAISLNNLAIDLYPEMNLPISVVVTEYEGAAPQEVEKLVTKTLEGSLGTVEGINTLQSQSLPGQSLIIMQFDWGSNIDEKANSIREKLDLVSTFLPEEAGKPLVMNIDPTQMPIMRLSVSGDIDQGRLTQIAEDVIKPRIERTPGVANVDIIGSRSKEVKVEVDPVYLNGYGLTVNQIIQTLASENLSASAGTLVRGDQELALRITGEFESVEQIEDVIIRLPQGSTVKLKEIASIEETYKKVSQIAKVAGKPSLSFDIQKKSDGNTIEVADEIYKSMEDIEQLLPEGVKLDTVYDLSIFIRQSVSNVISNLLIGGTLAILILFLFLRSLRSTLVIAITMPIAVVSTFSLVYFAGETLNLLTLGGLALGIGMMVDSAIVILENIFRYREQGYNMIDSAVKGTQEVGSAVVASALTTIAVFLPIVFVEGLAAELFRPLALTVTFSLLASLVASLTVVPMLSSKLLRQEEENKRGGLRKIFNPFLNGFERLMNKVYDYYTSLLKWALRKRKTVIFTTLALIIGTFALVPMVGTEFIPSMDQGEINIDITLPKGTILDETNKAVQNVEAKVYTIEEVEKVFTSAGSGGSFAMGLGSSNIGNLYVRLVPQAERDRSTNEVMEQIRAMTKKVPGADIKVTQVESGGMGTGSPITIKISGDEIEILNQLAERVKTKVEEIDGTRNVVSSTEEGRPEIQVIVDRDKAAHYGLTYSQILSTVKTGFNGQVATRYRSGGQELDVRVTLPDEYKQDMTQVKDILLQTPRGVSIPLQEVAELVNVKGPAQIDREDQKRYVTVGTGIIGRDLGSVTADIDKELDKLNVPDGYYIEIGGQAEDMAESFADLGLALILAIFLVYMVMAVQFEAITYPFIIMFSMPATFIGIILGLVVTGRALSIPAFIGVIMLAGIVVNNAIVLVDYINILRRRGIDRYDAIIQAGPNRLRPILMTTLTTILGLIPLTLGIGEGSETQAPMATVVVFGLSFSTLVTLVLVPVIYTYVDDFEQWFRGKFAFSRHSQKVSE